jgi:maleate cis-trans isomerase
MLGWRARLGAVVPSNNTVLEPEFWNLRPDGVTLHTARVLSYGPTPEGIARMEQAAMRACEELKAGALDVLSYACLATSLVKGPGWSAALIGEVKSRFGLPACTAAGATVAALQALGARRIAFATPYPERIHALVQPYMEASGLVVAGLANTRFADSIEVCRAPPGVAYRRAQQADTLEAEAVCIVATDFQTLPIIAALEADLGKPVVTTNQAVLWMMLGLAKAKWKPDGLGQLFERAPPADGL